MDDPGLLSRFTVILWRPASPGNVGSVARAMKNMGFTRLAIAEPRTFRDPEHFSSEARKMAWGAYDLLDARREHPTIADALAGASLVAGTTSRPQQGIKPLPPRELAGRLVDAAWAGPVCLLFGQESIGLTREALSLCQLIGTVPSSGRYSSLNLAQAALLFLYEIRMEALARDSAPAPEDRARRDSAAGPPTRSEVESFYTRLTETLDEIGFFEGSARGHMVRELRKIFNRALWSRRDLAIMEGLVHRIRLGLPRRGRG